MTDVTFTVTVRVDHESPDVKGEEDRDRRAAFALETLQQLLCVDDDRPFATNSVIGLALWGIDVAEYELTVVEALGVTADLPGLGESVTSGFPQTIAEAAERNRQRPA